MAAEGSKIPARSGKAKGVKKPKPGGVREASEDAGAKDNERRGPRFVVGVGASAGGLGAISELLGRSSQLPVRIAENGMKLEADSVYVIPPNFDMCIFHGALTLFERQAAAGRTTRQLPVDYFFKSLAQDQGTRAIGVILSGTGSDGAVGMAAIKSENGFTFVQDPKSAEYDGMPRAAINAGAVDFTGTPREIARQLLHVAEHPYVHRLHSTEEPLAEAGTDELNRLFLLVRNATGVDFSLYKRSTVERRIMRRMLLLKMTKLGEYIEFMQHHKQEAQALFQDLLISVTAFFRDPESFEVLKKKIYPRIREAKDGADPWRVWVPGCATGEEAYSVAISLLEFFEDNHIGPQLQVFASDINEVAIDKARTGRYPESILEGVSQGRLQTYFQAVEDGFQVRQYVREQCIFATHDITRDPPFSRMDFISFRNVLIYLDSVLQKRVIPVLHYALQPWGFLMLGSSESIVGHSELLNPVDKKYRIYAKRPTASQGPPAPKWSGPATGRWYREAEIARNLSAERQPRFDVVKEANQTVLNRYSPPGVIIDGNMDIIQFRGQTADFLEHPAGRASFNIMGMAREGLGLEIRTAVFEARKTKAPVSKAGIRLHAADRPREIKLDVIPMETPTRDEYFLVLFEEARPEPRPPAAAAPKPAGGPEIQELEKLRLQLQSNKQYLQSMIEEKEQSNEELRAANEEIQSSNEELQSINEELETAKEELQSTNEELTTVNDELQSRNQELARANDDLVNLLSSIGIPVIILDRELHIRRFTPGAEKTLNVIAGDIGRPIGNINIGIDIPNIADLSFQVMEEMSMVEKEVQDRNGIWRLMRMRPYKTSEKRIDGVVISFTDVDDFKRALERNRREVRLRGSLNDIIMEVNAAGDVDEIVSRVAKMGQEALGAAAAAVIVREGKKWRIRSSSGFVEAPDGRVVSDADLPAAVKTANRRLPQIVRDMSREGYGKAFVSRELGVNSVLAIPLMERGKDPWGAIEFYSTGEAGGFSQSETDFATKLTAGISLALANLGKTDPGE